MSTGPSSSPASTASSSGTTGRTASIGREDVAHLARLARLALSDEELDRFGGQLDVILNAVSRIGDLDTADVPPTSHSVPLTNVTREDVVSPSLGAEAVLAAAPAAEDGRFRVPRILEEEA